MPLLSAGEMGAGVVGVCVGDDELLMVGDRVGDVLILIWAAAAVENIRPDADKSRGSIDDNMSRSRSISHFRLEMLKKTERSRRRRRRE